MKPHPWMLKVHTSMLESKAALSCTEIRGTYGDPEGRQPAADRLHQALARGWFDVITSDGAYLYKAKPRRGARYSVWTPAKDELLAKWWPIEGAKCGKRFPDVTPDGVRSRVEKLNKALPEGQKIHKAHKAKRSPRKAEPREPQQLPISRDGLPRATSIWALASAIGGSHEAR